MLPSSAAQAAASEPLQVSLSPSWNYEHDVVVLAGGGGEATVEHLLQRGVRRVVVYLTPESHASPDSRVRTVRSSDELWETLMTFDPPPYSVVLRRVPGGGVSGELNQELARLLQKAASNRATFAAKGEVWVRHSLRNMRYLAERPSIAALHGKFAKKPCVIVSPGPSLAKNIALLPALKGKALLIAGNRSVAPLKQIGVAPDLVVVADPIDLRYQLQGNALEGAGALLLDLVVHPGMFELEARRHFLYTAVHEVAATTSGALGSAGLLQSGGSVATTAFRLALELGCDPILFVGQDLALSGDQYYVPSAPDGATRISVNNGIGVFQNSSSELKRAVQELGGVAESRQATQHFVQVRGWDGQRVYTSVQFDNYRRWLEATTAALESRVRVLNCTEGGAYIQAMEHLPLADALNGLELGPLDVDGVLDQAYSSFQGSRTKKQVERQVTRMQHALNEALSEVARCETLVARLESDASAFKSLEKCETKLRAALAQAPFVTAWASTAVEAARRTCANATSLADNVRATRALYAVVKDSAHATRPILAETLRHVKRQGS
ncbi:MAG TPA: 6-hydroxymethylpterin diphosphokinase MptE-like protein [Polyangiaceae bacterium]|nr:6-hydroxymethylpterin diphosphokinase MptE-like protein [Polyangiaceae bacterium]